MLVRGVKVNRKLNDANIDYVLDYFF